VLRDRIIALLLRPDLLPGVRDELVRGLAEDAALEEGSERYDTRGVLGSGGMGEVLKVHDRLLRRDVAMKVLKGRMARHDILRKRFIEEAQATAQLAHPGIVPVHDMGELPDRRPYFIMREIEGRTLTDVIAEVHASIDGSELKSAWTFRRLIQAFHSVCETVAYAHSRGVLHRDLKPDNVLLGSFGEVMVADWGLAMVRDLESDKDWAPIDTIRGDDESGQTHAGHVLGTPDFMSPEQAHGERDAFGPPTDVWALGAILYVILTGSPPFTGDGVDQVLELVRTADVPAPSRPGFSAPPELVETCLRAMSRKPTHRFADARLMAVAIDSWLEGARKREQALELLAEALSVEPEASHARAVASQLRERAQVTREAVPRSAPVADKIAYWDDEDRAEDLDREAERRVMELTVGIRGALVHVPDLPEAHRELARVYRAQHERSVAAGLRVDADRYEVLLRAHDRGEHGDYLRGEGRISLNTNIPCIATISRYERRHRSLHAVKIAEVQTPVDRALPIGSYLVEFAAEGHPSVRYPVFVERLGHWEDLSISMPETLGEDDIFVAAGPFTAGGDPHSAGGLPLQEVWVDSFVIRRYPVTNAEYLVFLNALVGAGQTERAVELAPRERARMGLNSQMVYGLDADGRFQLVPDADGDVWNPEWPVLMIDWGAAFSYADWMADQTGDPWRLARELEWEKAARGVDRRVYPWGDDFDSSFCNSRQSMEGRALPTVVSGFPVDCSPYGARHMAGGAREWCADRYVLSRLTAPIGALGPYVREREAEVARVLRGGSWLGTPTNSRTSTRVGVPPNFRIETTGFRLARSWKEKSQES